MPRLLVIDDSPLQARYAHALLAEAGHEVEIAPDGIAALEALAREEFDAVVSDLVMPRMDGLELVEAVRRDFPGLPVIMITAHGSEAVAARALRAGAASYVPKGRLREDLVVTVREVLALAGADPAHRRLLGCLEGVDLRFSLDNDSRLITPLIGEVQRAIAQAGLCDRTGLLRVGIAMREALVNAMEHGNLEADSDLRQDDERVYRRLIDERRDQSPYRDRRVHFRGRVDRAEAVFNIRDEGPGFDVSALPDPTDPANLERIGGRGLLLMRSFMDEVRHNATGNELTMIKRAGLAMTVRGRRGSPLASLAFA